MARKKFEEPYFNRLAFHMVRTGKDIWQASVELELGLRPEEAGELMKNYVFQGILRTERIKFYNELSNNPDRSKETLIGQAMFCVEKLMDQENYDKALQGILNLAKIEGFVGSETNVNVFGGLTSKQLAEIREQVKKRDELPAVSGNA